MKQTETEYIQRKERLKKVAETYFDSLKQKTFSAIPFSDNIVLRAPLSQVACTILSRKIRGL